jgi:hypothetical protein
MSDETNGFGKVNIPLNILFYLLWLITVALGILILFISRSVVMTAIALLIENFWLHRILDKGAFVFAGIGILVVVGWSEYYLRKGMRNKKLLKNFLRVLGIEVLFIFGSHIFRDIVIGFQGIGLEGFVLTAAELLVGLGALVYSLLPERFNKLPI